MTAIVAKSLSLFVLAGLCEIGGGYLVWLWLRDDRGMLLGLLGAAVLILYGIVPTFQPAHFGRVYAAYGGIFVVLSIFWGGWIDQKAPDRFDLLGGQSAWSGCSSSCTGREGKGVERHKRTGGRKMKEIKAYVRVNMIDRVVRALEGIGVSNMTVIDVKAIWRDTRPEDLLYSLELAERYMNVAKLEILARDQDVPPIVATIEQAAWTGRSCDGLIGARNLLKLLAPIMTIDNS